ncbi:MAG TPA: DUF72 domain-containing protein [Vicinamibacterales bacterium]|nr:DUF72 domain-containing protein [Vicinamibacterales bacterium]
MMNVRVGTSGWNYPTGKGTWNGVFYPARRPRGFDELRYYAEHFDIVEVNSTFYRMPEAGLAEKWAQRTPPDFQFAIKLYQKFTHPDMFLASAGTKDWSLSVDDVDAFRAGLAPLADAGKLAALLVQFPTSFHAEGAMREYLSWLLEMFAGYPLAVELRHPSWFAEGAAAETGARLTHGGASLVLADSPETSTERGPGVFSTPVPESPVYLRLHGRNYAAWWHHEKSEDRYNYLYSPAELAPFAAAATEASQAGRKVTAFMNNHFSAKAVANAAILRSQLGQTVPGLYEREMVNRYPDLEGIVTTSGLPL